MAWEIKLRFYVENTEFETKLNGIERQLEIWKELEPGEKVKTGTAHLKSPTMKGELVKTFEGKKQREENQG